MNAKDLRKTPYETIRANKIDTGNLFHASELDIGTLVLNSCNLTNYAIKEN